MLNKISKITLTLIFGQLLAVNSIITQGKEGNTKAIDSAMSALDEFMEAFNGRGRANRREISHSQLTLGLL